MSHPQSIPFQQALASVVETAAKYSLPTEQVPLASALGRVTSSAVLAPIDVPGFAASRMDGYAINTNFIKYQGGPPYTLGLGTAIHAAKQNQPQRCENQAIPIMTGGMMPEDADAIVIKEQAQKHAGQLLFEVEPKIGQYIRAQGADVQKGEVVLPANTELDAPSLAQLASLGIATTAVWRQPKVALMMSGDELVSPGNPCEPGEIYDANSVMLSSWLQSLGCQVTQLPPLADDQDRVVQRLQSIQHDGYDLMISVGGVSQGDKDWLPSSLLKTGQVIFHKVMMKPGFPLLFGTLGKGLFFGLPGNPVSAFVTASQLIKPAIRHWFGQDIKPLTWQAKLSHEWRKQHDRVEFLRAVYRVDEQGQLQVKIMDHQQSSHLGGLVAANCLLVVPEGPQHLQKGQLVAIQPLNLS